jgi:HK97 family phage major capsid protein
MSAPERSINIPLPSSPQVLPWIARSLLAGERFQTDASVWAERQGAPPAAVRILKTSIPSAVTTSSTWAGAISGDYATAVAAFIDSMKNSSAFFAILAAGGFTRIPFNLRVGLVTLGATGYLVGAGKPVPLSRLALANNVLTPDTIGAMLVTSDEVINDVSAAGMDLFNSELKAAVGVEADVLFVSALGETGVEDLSGSTDPGTARVAFYNALSVVAPTQSSRCFWVAARDTIWTLAAVATADDAAAFPTVGITGGTLLGIPLLVSDAVASGKMYLLDGARIAANADEVALGATGAGAFEMSDVPTNNSAIPTATSLVSMFQTNSVALKAIVRMACEVVDTDAVCVISGLALTPSTT